MEAERGRSPVPRSADIAKEREKEKKGGGRVVDCGPYPSFIPSGKGGGSFLRCGWATARGEHELKSTLLFEGEKGDGGWAIKVRRGVFYRKPGKKKGVIFSQDWLSAQGRGEGLNGVYWEGKRKKKGGELHFTISFVSPREGKERKRESLHHFSFILVIKERAREESYTTTTPSPTTYHH